MTEFFEVRTVAQALAGFQPKRRVGATQLDLAEALGRVLIDPIAAPHDLPGFSRATVDGYAVRAADTFGASEGLPAYLDLAGAVTMGVSPTQTVPAGGAIAIPTGGALPVGADAVVMVEYTTPTTPTTIEVTRPVAPGEGIIRADEDVAAGAPLVPAGRPLRPQDLGVLAAAGITRLTVAARPQVTIISTGDEVVPPQTPRLRPGQVRDATASAIAGLVIQAGGQPHLHGIEPDDPTRLRTAVTGALDRSDLVVVSAGSSVGRRDRTADVIAELGPPGIWCHGLAIKPGKPTVLAQAGSVPVVGLPGNPLSALVVFRLIGVPLIHLIGRIVSPAPAATFRTTITRDVPSAAGRLDVVQVRLTTDGAEPIFGASALLSVLSRADGFVVIDDAASGLYAGDDVLVERYS